MKKIKKHHLFKAGFHSLMIGFPAIFLFGTPIIFSSSIHANNTIAEPTTRFNDKMAIEKPSEITTIETVETEDKENIDSDSVPPVEISYVEPLSTDGLEMPIFMYHHIKDTSSDPLTVSLDKFRKQLDLIENSGFKTTNFLTINALPKDSKPIILTFDDAYDNFYTHAFPELRERGMLATIYVITDKIGQPGYMTLDQITEVSKYGIEIGSHTLSHPNLTSLDPERISNELTSSMTVLSNLTNKEIISLCYPAGQHNEEIMTIAQKSGYKFAVSIFNKAASFDNLYNLERFRITEETYTSVYLK